MSTQPTYTYTIESGKNHVWTYKVAQRLTFAQARSAIEKTCKSFNLHCLRIYFADSADPQPEKKFHCEICDHDTHEIYMCDGKCYCWVCYIQNLSYCTECGTLQKKENLTGGMCADCSYIAPQQIVKPKYITSNKENIKCSECGSFGKVGYLFESKIYCHDCARGADNPIIMDCKGCGSTFSTWELDPDHHLCPHCYDNAPNLGIIY